MRKALFAGAILIYIAGSGTWPATASDGDVVSDSRACAAITISADRLQCFDLLVGKHSLNAPVPALDVATGAWSVSVGKSPVDDSKRIVARLEASKVTGGQGLGDAQAILVVRCLERELNLYLSTSEFVGMREGKTVLIRLGAQTAKQDRWTPSSDGRAVGLWGGDGKRAASLVNDLISDDPPSLVIRSDIYNGPPITAQFDVTGARQALEPIIALCSTKPPSKTH
jgi:hypothetical protein